MAIGEPIITIVGTVTGDPELKFLPSGQPVCNFSVAVNGRKKNQDTQQWEEASSTFYRCAAWAQLGENVAASISKGDQVIAMGPVHARTWEHEGKSGTSLEMTLDAVGPNLRFAEAKPVKGQRSGGDQGQQQGGAWGQQQQPQGGAWGQPQGAAPGWAGQGAQQGAGGQQQGAQPPQQGGPPPGPDPWATPPAQGAPQQGQQGGWGPPPSDQPPY